MAGDATASGHRLTLDPGALARWAAGISAAILAIAYARLYVVLNYGTDTVLMNFRYFDLDEELAVPAWYSSLLLVACGVLLFAISRLASREGDPDATRWTLLAAIFPLLGLDEAVSIHERVIDPLREALNLSGIFYFAWVIPAAVLVAALAIYMLPFLLRLPRRSALVFVAAGGLYVGGALGMEMVGGAVAAERGTENTLYTLIVAVEETLEILGLTAFFAALVDHMGRIWPAWTLQVRTQPAAASVRADGRALRAPSRA